MSPSAISPDARAVVRAAEALTTQVRRIADALSKGAPVTVGVPDDDATTTPDDTTTPLRLTTPCAVCTHPYNWHKAGVCQVDDCGCTAFARGSRCVQCGSPDVRYRNYQEQPFCWPCANGEQQAPDADEDAQRERFRHNVRNLLDRVDRRVLLTETEAALLRHHYEAEVREADFAREQRDQARGERDRSDETARLAMEQRQEMAEERFAWQERGDRAEQRLARICDMVDAWERRLPATIRTATAAEAVRLAAAGDDRPVMFSMQPDAGLRAELEQAQAAIERVRALVAGIAHPTSAGITDYDLGRQEMATAVVMALTEDEQPTTEAAPKLPRLGTTED